MAGLVFDPTLVGSAGGSNLVEASLAIFGRCQIILARLGR